MKTEPVTGLTREATKILAELHDTKEPVLITEHGLASAYRLMLKTMNLWLTA